MCGWQFLAKVVRTGLDLLEPEKALAGPKHGQKAYFAPAPPILTSASHKAVMNVIHLYSVSAHFSVPLSLLDLFGSTVHLYAFS